MTHRGGTAAPSGRLWKSVVRGNPPSGQSFSASTWLPILYGKRSEQGKNLQGHTGSGKWLGPLLVRGQQVKDWTIAYREVPGPWKKIHLCGHEGSKSFYHTLVSTRDYPPWINVLQRPSAMEEILSSHLNGKARPGDVRWHPSLVTLALVAWAPEWRTMVWGTKACWAQQ